MYFGLQVLTPLQAARVLVACKPNPPDVLALLEEVHVHFVEGYFERSTPSQPIPAEHLKTSKSAQPDHGCQPPVGNVRSTAEGLSTRSLSSRWIGGSQGPREMHEMHRAFERNCSREGKASLRSFGSSPNLVGTGQRLIGELEGNRARFY